MKQAILIRADLKLPKGKACAQAAHASVDATLKSDKKRVEQWKKGGMAKIVLKVADEKELTHFFQLAKEKGMIASLISDAGKTVVEPGTKTAVAIGPDENDAVDTLTKQLKLY
ncbi:MAG TPA: peptidyl-tRNA hydrolase Pth2 [Candidatus Nanoarchaeia archaeon]|nr:peptidyl-tRNA hydrolase Pth2 [Candidatus Nanoarchaeia archaeon]